MQKESPFSKFANRLKEFIRGNAAYLADDQPFDLLARELFRLQYEHNPALRNFCELRRASPETVTHWSDIPALPTAAFKELDVTSLPPTDRTQVFYSSGTTEGKASRHFHNRESITLYEMSLIEWFRRHLMPDPSGPNLRMIILTPPPSSAPHSSLAHMLETVRMRFGGREARYAGKVEANGAWVLEQEKIMEWLGNSQSEQQPVMLLGTAFNFVHLLDRLAEDELRLPAGSRLMETGGYKGRTRSLPKAELHSLLSARLGIPAGHIVSEYGMCELSSQGYDGIIGMNEIFDQREFQFPPWARVQIISPETGLEVGEGEPGLIRIFDLANVWSALAVQSEDLGRKRGIPPAKERGIQRAGALNMVLRDESRAPMRFELLGRVTEAEARGCSLMAG